MNTQTVSDEGGEFCSWIEVFNLSQTAFSLSTLYLSDDNLNLTKHRFPVSNNLLVNGAEHMMIWADGDTAQGPAHISFFLSPSGGWLFMSAPDGVTVVDSIQYPAMTIDESYGRNGDGNASWIMFPTPTPNAPNILSSVDNDLRDGRLPRHQVVSNRIHFYGSEVEIIDWAGRRIGTISGRDGVFDVSSLPSGSYIARTEDGKHLRFMKM